MHVIRIQKVLQDLLQEEIHCEKHVGSAGCTFIYTELVRLFPKATPSKTRKIAFGSTKILTDAPEKEVLLRKRKII